MDEMELANGGFNTTAAVIAGTVVGGIAGFGGALAGFVFGGPVGAVAGAVTCGGGLGGWAAHRFGTDMD